MPNMKQYLVAAETSKVNIEALIQLFGFLAKKEKQVFKATTEKKVETKETKATKYVFYSNALPKIDFFLIGGK